MRFEDRLNESLDAIAEAIGASMPSKVRSIVNRKLVDLLSGYFPNIPLGQIMELFSKYGLVMLQEDNTQWSGFFTGADGHATIDVASSGSAHEVQQGKNVYTAYEPFANTMLDITWHKMEESGRYEVVAYLS